MGRDDQTGGKSRAALRHVSVGIELLVALLVGLFGGIWLDGKLGTKPWLMVAGVVLGMAAGFLNFFRQVLPRKDDGPEEGEGE